MCELTCSVVVPHQTTGFEQSGFETTGFEPMNVAAAPSKYPSLLNTSGMTSPSILLRDGYIHEMSVC